MNDNRRNAHKILVKESEGTGKLRKIVIKYISVRVGRFSIISM